MAPRSPAAHAAWLGGTVEAALDPDLPIVDPHHHLWDHIAPAYLLDDLLADTTQGHNVRATVFIECGWGWDASAAPELVAVPETARVAGLATESECRDGAVIAKIVGHADLRYGAAATGRALDALTVAGEGRFVGIRHATAWDPDPQISNHRTDPIPHLMADVTWRAGFRELAKRGLTYDAWLYHPQIPELRSLAREFPETPMVLDHLGGPLAVRSYRGRDAEVRAAALASLRDLAGCPNVSVKLGGIGMGIMGGAWSKQPEPPNSEQLAAHWSEYVRAVIDLFGTQRCMFESNFPVDRESCSYVVLWNAFKRIVADTSPFEKEQLFSGTASRFYGIRPSLLEARSSTL